MVVPPQDLFTSSDGSNQSGPSEKRRLVERILEAAGTRHGGCWYRYNMLQLQTKIGGEIDDVLLFWEIMTPSLNWWFSVTYLQYPAGILV